MVKIVGRLTKQDTWFSIISDAEIRRVDGQTKVLLNARKNGKDNYVELKAIHISTLRSFLHRYNLSNPENYISEKNMSKAEIIPTLRRIMTDDVKTYKSYVQRVEKATGQKFDSFSPRDIERANALFLYLKRHPEDPLHNDKWESDGIIKEVWRLATDVNIKFDQLANNMENWLIAHGADPYFYKYDKTEQEEILKQMSMEYSDNDYFDFNSSDLGAEEAYDNTYESIFGR